MQFFKIRMCLACLALALVHLNGAAQAAPSASITASTYAGTGCPAGTANIAVKPGGTDLTVAFKQFNIAAKAPVAQQSKNCVFKVTVLPPGGQQVSVARSVYQVSSQQIADIHGQAQLGGGAIATLNQTITGPTNVQAVSSAGTAWSNCGAATVLDDNISLTVKPQVLSPNGEAVLSEVNYVLSYQPCGKQPPSAFTFALSGNATTGYTAGGNCNVGHKIKLMAHHSSYVIGGSGNQIPPITAAEFESHCGGTNVIPTPAQIASYVWAGKMPPSNTVTTVVLSNSPPPPQPANAFKPGLWKITGEQTEATPQNPGWPRTTVNLPAITIN